MRTASYPKEYYSQAFVPPSRMAKSQFAKLYGLSWRTINRDIKKIEFLNNELMKVNYNKHSKKLRVAWVKVLFLYYSPPLK